MPGQIYQVCAGPDGSAPAGELIEFTVELLRENGTAKSIDVPRFVSLEEFEAYVAWARRRGDRLLNELLRILSYTLPHLGMSQRFDNVRCIAGLAGSGIEQPSIRETYARVVKYCIRTEFGRRGTETVAAAG